MIMVIAPLALGALAWPALASAKSADASSCPTSGGTPFATQLTNGTIKLGNNTVNNLTASGCGLETTAADGSLSATITKDNATFNDFNLTVSGFTVPVHTTALGDFTGPVTKNADGSVDVALTGQVQVSPTVLGSTCDIGPITLTLTTKTSGALTGSPFVGTPPAPLSGKLVAGDFAVPAAQPSSTCSSFVASQINNAVPLPQQPGGSTLTYDASLTVSATG
jgi:hypothetical protein